MGIFMAVGVVAFVGFIGLSIDTIRGYLIQSRLSSALDAAGLAGARVMFSDTRDADIQMYFDANFPPGYLGATVTGPTFTVDPANEILTLSAQATMNTSFMRLLGFEKLNVAASSEITRQTDFLDVVLAIDMSGSMNNSVSGGGTRIAAARTAATELVNILFGADELKALLKIGLVPWSSKVNVTLRGTTYTSSTPETVPTYGNPFAADTTKIYRPNNSPVPLLSPPAGGWKGCVYSRYEKDASSTNDADLLLGPALRGAESGLVGIDWPAWQPIGPEGEPGCAVAPWWADCGKCLTHGITPLQGTKSGIQEAIDELLSPTGSTNAVAGLDWAWRVLMPDAPFTEADPNPEGRRTQAIILLTDGEQTGNYGDAYKRAFGYNTAAQAGGQDQRLKDLANIIKAQGVLIYAIQFGDPSTDLENLLKDVASGPDKPFYQKAPGAEELRAVFKEVANDLSQLRVSM